MLPKPNLRIPPRSMALRKPVAAPVPPETSTRSLSSCRSDPDLFKNEAIATPFSLNANPQLQTQVSKSLLNLQLSDRAVSFTALCDACLLTNTLVPLDIQTLETALMQVYTSLTSDEFSTIVSARTIDAVFKMIKSHINHPINPPSKDGVDTNQNTKTLASVYQILNWILSNERIRLSFLQSHINQELVNILFKAILSTTPSERVSAGRSLVHIGHRFCMLRPLLALRTSGLLSFIRANPENGHSLVPVFQFILDSGILPLLENRTFFSTVFIPLITIPDFELTYSDFAQVLDHFLRAIPELSSVFANYLVKHWPTDGMVKRAVFFQMLRDLIVARSDYIFDRLLGICLEKIASLFDDAVCEMVEEAIVAIGKQDIQELFERVPVYYVQKIWQHAKQCSECHYELQIRKLAGVLLWVFENNGITEADEVRVTDERADNWEAIRSVALKNWPKSESARKIERAAGLACVSH
jgi:hypothetical protein